MMRNKNSSPMLGVNSRDETIRVDIKYFTTLREITGKLEEPLILPSSATVGDAVFQLIRIYGAEIENYLLKDGQLRPQFQVLINGRTVDSPFRLNAKLHDGCTLVILPPAGGGSVSIASSPWGKKQGGV